MMGHQYPLNSPQPCQNQRDFSAATSAGAVVGSRRLYFDPSQARPAGRIVHRQPQLYQQQQRQQQQQQQQQQPHHQQQHYHQQQQQQQQSNFSLQTRTTQLPQHAQPSVIDSTNYQDGDLFGQPFEEGYNQLKFMTDPQLPPACAPDNHQYVVAPGSYDYHEQQQQQQLHMSDGDGGEHLPLYHQESYVDQQQQQPINQLERFGDGVCQRMASYQEDTMTSVTARQQVQHPHAARRQQQPQQQPDGAPLTSRRRLSVPQQYQPINVQLVSQQQPQQNSPNNLNNYFRYEPRARSSLSDEQVYQHTYDSRLPQQQHQLQYQQQQQPQYQHHHHQHRHNQHQLQQARRHPVLVQNSTSQQAAKVYYAQTNDDHQYSPASSSSLDIIPSPNLPLPDRQDMIVDNATDNAAAAATASIYAEPGDEQLLQAQLPSASLDEMNTPFGCNQPFDPVEQKRSPPPSSMHSELSALVTPSATVLRDLTSSSVGAATAAAAAAVATSSAPTVTAVNEAPAQIMASAGERPSARSHADNRLAPDGMAVAQYERTVNNFNGVYSDIRNGLAPRSQQQLAPAPLRRAQRSQQQQQRQQVKQPFTSHAKSGASGTPLPVATGFGKSYKQQQHFNEIRHLSNPKSNPHEYLDMRGDGNLSQEWLDTICSHLIEHMNNFGICVIDNFLGSIKGELILTEVHRLYSNGRYSKGRLVSDKLDNGRSESEGGSSGAAAATGDGSSGLPAGSSNRKAGDNLTQNGNCGGSDDGAERLQTAAAAAAEACSQQQQQHQPQQARQTYGARVGPMGAIRSDRVIWVDGCEDGCAEINNLIQTLCSVITNSSRLSLYTNNGLDKVNINKRTKAHVACYPGNGTRYIKHVDNPNGDGRVITAIYYLNKDWNTKRDGGLLRMFPAGMDEVANIEPLFDRALFFWSDRRNPHEVLPSYRDRFAITVWYIGESRP